MLNVVFVELDDLFRGVPTAIDQVRDHSTDTFDLFEDTLTVIDRHDRKTVILLRLDVLNVLNVRCSPICFISHRNRTPNAV